MHRLFVAVRPPRAIRERLLGAMGGVHNARWQTDDQLHLTLRFIGEVNRHCAEDVAAALGNVAFPRFDLALAGVGQFGRGKRQASLWAGVTPHDRIAALHRKVDQACIRTGLPPEGRTFAPHITLARLNRGAGPAETFLDQAAALASARFTVDSFGLYESELGSEGATYTIVERYPLMRTG